MRPKNQRLRFFAKVLIYASHESSATHSPWTQGHLPQSNFQMERPIIDSLKQFGDKVRSVRITKGLSQEQLAELCDLDRTYIGGVERGERNIGLRNLLKIAAALNIKAQKLLEGVGE